MHRYQIVDQEGILKIHENSLKIMEEIGVVFSYDPALEILAKGGAKVVGKTAHFPRKVVEDALKTVPSSFTLHARNPEKNVEITTEKTAYVGPYGAPFVLELGKERRDGTMEDFINLAKICQSLDSIDIQSHIYCEPCDTAVNTRYLEMIYEAMKHNEKPIMGGVLGYDDAKRSIELASIPFGGLAAIQNKPIMASIPCTLTPLSYDDKMAGAIIAYAEHGQAQLVNSLSMAGTTTPATLSGAISLQNAEVLAGIVLAQMVNPGTPIVYSASGSCSDMKNSSLAVGAPESAIFSLINGQLTKFYNIPCRISGGLSDSKCCDAQAGYESMMTLMMAQMGGGNFILHSAGILENYNCVSYEKLIIDDEIIGMIRRINQGVTLDDNGLAYDVIKEVGPQGSFISHKHTFKNFRKEFYMPRLSDRNNFERWTAQGSPTAEQRANVRWKKILNEYVEPTMDANILKEMKAFIAKYK